MDYRVADLSLADFGRLEIKLAEHEMPGLMAMREQFGESKPLAGARIAGSIHMTTQTAVLIETLVALGAEVRWASCNIFSTQDQAAAAVVVGDGTPEAPAGSRCSPGRARRWRSTGADAGDPALARRQAGQHDPRRRRGRHPAGAQGGRGVKTGEVPRGRRTEDPEELHVIIALHQAHPRGGPWTGWPSATPSRASPRRPPPACTGCTRCSAASQLLFPAINVNDSVTKSKFDNKYGTRHSLIDGLNRATDVLIGGKVVLVCGYGDVGKGCAEALRGQGARVIVTEVDPICALQAAMDGYPGHHAGGGAAARRHLRHRDRLPRRHHRRPDEPDEEPGDRGQHRPLRQRDRHGRAGQAPRRHAATRSSPRSTSGSSTRNDGTDGDALSIIVLSEGRLMNLGNATGHPSFVMSNSFTNQVLAQIELFTKTDEYPVGRLHAAQAPGRGRGPAAPGRAGRQAHRADPDPGRLLGRPGRRAVQVGPLPLLSVLADGGSAG